MSSGLKHSTATALPNSARFRIPTAITQWRNWKLANKLAAVVLVPAIFAATLGTLQIRAQIHLAHEYSRLGAVVETATAVRSTATKLQEERTLAAKFLTAGTPSADQLTTPFAATDERIRRSTAALDVRSSAPAVHQAHTAVKRHLTRVPELRASVVSKRITPLHAIHAYTNLIHLLSTLDRSLISELSSAELSPTAQALHEIAVVDEEMRLQQALVLTGIFHGRFPTQIHTQLHHSETRRNAALSDFRATATPRQVTAYGKIIRTPSVREWEQTVRTVARPALALGEPQAPSIPPAISADTWEKQTTAALSALGTLKIKMDQRLHTTASVFEEDASDLAGLASVILVSALALAGVIAVVVARQLLNSLGTLRRYASEIARARLPQAVDDLLTGRDSPTPRDAVPVNTAEEVGQVARAFDDVHEQAVKLAADQAALQKNFRDSFVNVSRRSQALLERQLRLFEMLENKEEDPDQLATLFQLDHLATRMRRNNENLMVLSGSDPVRRFTGATPLADLLRAAISEIEHYPKVVVRPFAKIEIVSYVANDLARSLAELLDNAANFSAPDTAVTVSVKHQKDGSANIEIVDNGIGMSADELTSINSQLDTNRQPRVCTSRRMGLFVVGRLAARHRIHVHCDAGPGGQGIRTTVSLRPELLLHSTFPAVTLPQDTHERLRSDTTGAQHSAVDQRRPESCRSTSRPPLGDATPTTQDDGSTESDHASTGLFTPSAKKTCSSHDGNATPRHCDPDLTPIFDDLASAWFRVSPPPTVGTDSHSSDVQWPAKPAGAAAEFHGSEPSDGRRQWQFASDRARRRAEEVHRAEPETHTPSGLPRRNPRAHLLAGSAENTENEPATPRRNAEVARGRIASFQRGLWEGRHHKEPESSHHTSTIGHSTTAHHEFPDVNWSFQKSFEQPTEFDPNGLPSEYTATGLPRRTPRAQFAAKSGENNTRETVQDRDAKRLRERLGSFQRGTKKGKEAMHHTELSDE